MFELAPFGIWRRKWWGVLQFLIGSICRGREEAPFARVTYAEGVWGINRLARFALKVIKDQKCRHPWILRGISRLQLSGSPDLHRRTTTGRKICFLKWWSWEVWKSRYMERENHGASIISNFLCKKYRIKIFRMIKIFCILYWKWKALFLMTRTSYVFYTKNCIGSSLWRIFCIKNPSYPVQKNSCTVKQ